MEPTKGIRNLTLYNFHVIFNEPLFWGPIVIVSIQNLAHMPLPDIYYMEAAVLWLCVLLDIPAGALADVIGRRRTILIARILLLCSAIAFAIMTTPRGAWTGNVLWAIGYSLQSGADTALLYDTLVKNGAQEKFTRIEGRAVGARFIIVACCSLLAGILAKIDLRLPLQLGLPFMVIPLIAAFFFDEPERRRHPSVIAQLAAMKQGARCVIHSPPLRWIVGFAALVMATSKIWFFAYNPYFEAVSLPVVQYGVIFFLLNVVSWLSSHYAYWLEHLLGERRCVIGIVACIGVPILLMGLVPIPIFAYLVIIQNIARGFMRPFVGNYLNRHIAAETRATSLSIQSSAANLAAIIGLTLFGAITARISLFHSLLILGATFLFLSAISFWHYAKRISA